MHRITLLFCLFSQLAFSQLNFEFNRDISVFKGGQEMTDPWAGGLNYTQFSDFDFDYDGDLDLFVFDRSSDNVRIFSQENNGSGPFYQSVYNAERLFPEEVRYRATLVDYDGDGQKDLFTYGIGGLMVFRNIGNAIDGLQWELVSELLQSDYGSVTTGIFVSQTDIPAIVDVDGDGDIDILTFHTGGQRIEYHKNISMETYGVPDSLEFELRNHCWGKFMEDLNTSSVTLNPQISPCNDGGSIGSPEKMNDQSGSEKSGNLHAGSSILALDYTNSGVMDLILGDVSYPNLVYLENGGTTPNSDSPMVSVDNAFPSNTTPVDVHLFPAAFFLDVDFDGVKDLIVSPNASVISRNRKSVLFYKNTGSNELPNFQFIQDDFLQDQMIDQGLGSIPVFTDINEDGLDDLIVANYFRYKEVSDKESTFSYYLNTGTATVPAFTLIDEDYLNLTSSSYGIRLTPTFGDIDGDNDDDLFMCSENGSLIYYENQSSGSGAVYTTAVTNYTDASGSIMSSGINGVPVLFDLDNDGLLDMIFGRKDGMITYYKNTGTTNSPSFTLTNNQLGNIDISTINHPDGNATPHFFRQNDTTYLFIGARDGKLHYYNEIDNNLNNGDSFNLVSDNFLNVSVGKFSAFFVNDINDNGYLDLFIGQDLGGITRLEVDPSSTSSIDELQQLQQLTIYPNPATHHITIETNGAIMKNIQLYDLSGSLIQEDQIESSSRSVSLSQLPKGVYLIKVTTKSGFTLTKRLIKH